MTTIEKTLTALAVVLVLASVAMLILGEHVLGATSLVLSGAFYAFATTPRDPDERLNRLSDHIR